jgi:hypothetical protein
MKLWDSNHGGGAISVFDSGRTSGIFYERGAAQLISGQYDDVKISDRLEEKLEDRHCKGIEPPETWKNEHFRGKRSISRTKSGNKKKYLEAIFIVSKQLCDQYKGEGADLQSQLKPIYERYETIYNHQAEMYKSAGINLYLLDIVLWTKKDEIDIDGRTNAESPLLKEFGQWRTQKQTDAENDAEIGKWQRHDNAQLFMPVEVFSPGTIGLGYVNSLCGRWSTGVVADHHSNEAAVAATSAHEMGHNVGLNHDESHCECGKAPLFKISS